MWGLAGSGRDMDFRQRPQDWPSPRCSSLFRISLARSLRTFWPRSPPSLLWLLCCAFGVRQRQASEYVPETARCAGGVPEYSAGEVPCMHGCRTDCWWCAFCYGVTSRFTRCWTPRSIPIHWPFLHNVVRRVPPIVARTAPYPAIFNLNWFAACGHLLHDRHISVGNLPEDEPAAIHSRITLRCAHAAPANRNRRLGTRDCFSDELLRSDRNSGTDFLRHRRACFLSSALFSAGWECS